MKSLFPKAKLNIVTTCGEHDFLKANELSLMYLLSYSKEMKIEKANEGVLFSGC